jgi:transposase
MSYRPYAPPAPLLIGYDPVCDLPPDHLARLVEAVVEESLTVPPPPPGPGQPPFDPRLPIKVLVYGYATGLRSSRRLEQACNESLPYLFLTRGDTPSYKTLCRTRLEHVALIEQVWIGLFAVAERCGLKRVGQIVVDSSKLRADASPEAVLKAEEYAAVRAELQRILAEAQTVDEQEEQAGPRSSTRLGQAVEREQMRDILRRVRKQLAQAKRAAKAAPGAPTETGSPEPSARGPAPEAAPAAPTGTTAPAGSEPAPPTAPDPGGSPDPVPAGPRPALTRQMRARVLAALAALEAALTEGRQHLCLTDPDARMMGEGRSKRVQECYSYEVAVDRGAGLLVYGGVTQQATDNDRLEVVVAGAEAQEPEGVKAVDADCGFFSGGTVGRLIRAGIDTCVPDCNTAGDLHRGQPAGTLRAQGRGQVEFVYDPEADSYRCPEGNELRRVQRRVEAGQELTEYRAHRPCRDCPLAKICLTQRGAQYRTLKVSEYAAELTAARERFNEPSHRERYRRRGEVVETVFGFTRGTLGYLRFLLRGKERVEREGRLMQVAYQVRKVHGAWVGA